MISYFKPGKFIFG